MPGEAPPPVPSPPHARPPVPLGATCLTLVLGAGILTALCAGAAVLGLAGAAKPRIQEARAERARAAATQSLVEDAKAALAALAARLSAAARDAGELPEALAEAPPRDPWGRPIEYTRRSPDRGELRSAGPDGKLGTRDDVKCDVVK
jgi:hypothetical protein